MSERLNHPTMERLQAFVEASLEGAERAVVASHLTGCSECRAEVEELRSLFEALGSLPELAPGPGFADRVMRHVRVRRPSHAWAGAWAGATEWVEGWLERVAPKSTRGWAAASAVSALPLIGATVLVAWLLSQPGVSAQGLWTFLAALAGDAATGTWQWVWAQLSGSALAVWMARAAEYLGSVGRGEVGLAVVMFTTLTAGSIYVLYQNLFRTRQPRRIEHASYVI